MWRRTAEILSNARQYSFWLSPLFHMGDKALTDKVDNLINQLQAHINKYFIQKAV